jgi:hypothetical protein
MCIYMGLISYKVEGKLESLLRINILLLPPITLLLHCIAIPPVALQLYSYYTRPNSLTAKLTYL